MAKQLPSIDEKVLDTNFAMKLLGSLIKSFGMLVVLMETHISTKLTLQMVMAKLLQQESYKKNAKSNLEAIWL